MSDEIIVTGTRFAAAVGIYWGGFSQEQAEPNPNLEEHDQKLEPGEGGNPTPEEPDCTNSNPVIIDHPIADGASYQVPKNVTSTYLNNALSHLMAIYDNNPFNKAESVREFEAMYTDPTHPFFIDFKDWGPDGPAGSVGAGTITYFSQAVNDFVTTNAFEPFGNYFYGLAGTLAGLASEELYAAAALRQEGGSGFSDDRRDVPHVKSGIAGAQRYIARDQKESVLGVDENCEVEPQ